MKKRGFLPFLSVCALGLFGGVFFILPSLGGDVFLSPDETANAVMAKHFFETGAFRLDDPLLRDYPWVHPRSLVAHGTSLLPVGFLGMPFLVGIAWRIGGDFLMVLFPAALALSVAYPIWKSVRPLGRPSQIAGVIAWMTFPTVILYANRGLFPNLTVVSLAVWAAYAASRSRLAAAGVVAGLALAVRPVEAVWVLPWIAFAWQASEKKKITVRNIVMFSAPLLLVVGLFGILGWKTYGTAFTAGYQLRDPVAVQSVFESAADVVADAGMLPFGFHPRNMWFNVENYLVAYLWPWSLLSFAGLILFWKDAKKRPWILLAAWTVGALLIVYGQGVYQDHVRVGEVSLANSFLRYMLPISVIAVFLISALTQRIWIGVEHRAMRVAAVGALCFGVAVFGTWTSFFRDDEGILRNRAELQRYRVIRAAAERMLPTASVVFSERSDKIFFPILRAVSPLPSMGLIADMVNSRDVETAFFLRTLDAEGEAKWAAYGIRLIPVLDAGNESLYVPEPL